MKRLIVLLAFCCCLVASGQQIIFKTYTVLDGMVANPVRRVLQDSKGFIWIATWEGLSKYDGYRFTNYNTGNGLSSDIINDIFEGSDGTLYIAENNDNIDIIRNNKIIPTIHDGLTINRFYEIGPTTYFISDNKGIGRFDNGNIIASSQPVKSILDFAPLGDSLYAIFNSDFQLEILDRDFQRISPSNTAIAGYRLSRDSKDNVWFCTNDGLKLLDPAQVKNAPLKFKPLPSIFNHPYLIETEVHGLFEDDDDNYWISTINGLVKISREGNIQRFTIRNGLPTNLVTDLYQDREKNIWMCSKLGLVKLVMKNIHYFSSATDVEFDRVAAIFNYNDDHLIFNNFTKNYIINKQTLEIRPIGPQNTPTSLFPVNNKNRFIAVSPNAIWSVYANETSTSVSLPLPNEGFYSAAIDERGIIYAGSNSGVYVYSPGKKIRKYALDTRITKLIIDREGYIWAGTWDRGLFRFSPMKNEEDTAGRIEDLTHLTGDKYIRSIYEDRSGGIWIGTRYSGAFHARREKDKFHVNRYHRAGGLSSNWIYSFADDDSGNMWIGTYSGLNKLTPEDQTFRVFNFNRLNNYFGEVYTIFPDTDGIVWCGTFTGLIRFKDERTDAQPPPPVYLTSIITPGNRNNDSLLPALKYRDNRILFEFSSPAFINEESILYSYRLEGADTAWSQPSNQHSVSFASLEPGNYNFQVKAYGFNGSAGPVTSYPFRIIPPFWMNAWFIALCTLLLGVIAYSIYRYRIQQLVRLQKVRNRIATDLHDDIGSTLTNISILSELSNKNISQPELASKYLNRITEEVSASGQALDDIIWSVNTRNDTMEDMLVRMRRFAAEMFDDTSTICHLQLEPSAAAKKLSMEQRRDIYLIYKEALNNIYKHANAKNVHVNLNYSKQTIMLTIQDDGQGFDTNATTHRNGIKNMRSRVTKWKGRLDFNSGVQGTTLKVEIPVQS